MMRRSTATWLSAALLVLFEGVGIARAAGPDPGSLDCFLEPRRRAIVSAPVIGVVRSVEVDPGAVVEAGQVLARLESQVEEATRELARARADGTGRLREAKARHRFEAKRFERGQQLRQQNVISDREIEEFESAREVAESELDAMEDEQHLARLELSRAEAVLGQRTIRSPFSGVVVRQLLSEGEYADPPQLFELVQLDPLRVEVFAPIALLGKVALGDEGFVVPEDPVGGRHRARVVEVDPVVDPKSATFRLKLEFANPGNAIAAGLRCRLELPIEGSATRPHGAEEADRLAKGSI